MGTINNMPTIEQLFSSVRVISVSYPLKKEAVNEALKVIKVKNASYRDAQSNEVIEKNDIAVISIKSDIAKYNHDELKIVVGRNYYNSEIETALLNMKIGDTAQIKIDTDVTIKILNIVKKVYKDVTIEMIKAVEPEYNTIEEYENHLFEIACSELKESKINTFIMPRVFGKLYNTPEVLNSDDDYKDYVDNYIEKVTRGKELTDMEKMRKCLEWLAVIEADETGIDKTDDVKKIPEDELENQFATKMGNEFHHYIINITFAQNNGKCYDEKAYSEYAEAFAKRRNLKIEDVKKNITYITYKMNQSDRDIKEMLLAYSAKNCIKESYAK